MIINRTYRTWNQDYYIIYDGLSVGVNGRDESSSSSSSSSSIDSSSSSSSSSTSMSSSSSSTSMSSSSSSTSSSSSSSSSTSLSSESSSSSSSTSMSSSSSSSTSMSSSSSSSSSFDCPNNISAITATIRGDLSFTTGDFISVNINGAPESDNYILLNVANTAGSTTDSNRVFYGYTGHNGVKIEREFISISINGSTYYMQVYSGESDSNCRSNIIGTTNTSGTFMSAGYVCANINTTDVADIRYIEIFTKS